MEKGTANNFAAIINRPTSDPGSKNVPGHLFPIPAAPFTPCPLCPSRDAQRGAANFGFFPHFPPRGSSCGQTRLKRRAPHPEPASCLRRLPAALPSANPLGKGLLMSHSLPAVHGSSAGRPAPRTCPALLGVFWGFLFPFHLTGTFVTLKGTQASLSATCAFAGFILILHQSLRERGPWSCFKW